MGKNFLQAIARHRFLTAKQLSSLLSVSEQSVRRKIRNFRSQRLIAEPFRLFSSSGRPQDCHVLTNAGYDFLGFKGNRVKRVSQGQHQYLQNWFLISLKLFLDSNSEFSAVTFTANPILDDRVYKCKIPSRPGGSLDCSFIPDISMKINKGDQSLLFFVEVDGGTESLTGQRSIQEKIDRYRVYRGANLYKFFEKVFDAKFNGFRVLFVAPDENRVEQFNRLISSFQPADFVWVTSLDAVTEDFEGSIWHKGGGEKLSSVIRRS